MPPSSGNRRRRSSNTLALSSSSSSGYGYAAPQQRMSFQGQSQGSQYPPQGQYPPQQYSSQQYSSQPYAGQQYSTQHQYSTQQYSSHQYPPAQQYPSQQQHYNYPAPVNADHTAVYARSLSRNASPSLETSCLLMAGVLAQVKSQKGFAQTLAAIPMRKQLLLAAPKTTQDIKDLYERIFLHALPFHTTPQSNDPVPDILDQRVCSAFGHVAKAAVEKTPVLIIIDTSLVTAPVFLNINTIDNFVSEVDLGLPGTFSLRVGKHEHRFSASSSLEYQRWENAFLRAMEIVDTSKRTISVHKRHVSDSALGISSGTPQPSIYSESNRNSYTSYNSAANFSSSSSPAPSFGSTTANISSAPPNVARSTASTATSRKSMTDLKNKVLGLKAFGMFTKHSSPLQSPPQQQVPDQQRLSASNASSRTISSPIPFTTSPLPAASTPLPPTPTQTHSIVPPSSYNTSTTTTTTIYQDAPYISARSTSKDKDLPPPPPSVPVLSPDSQPLSHFVESSSSSSPPQQEPTLPDRSNKPHQHPSCTPTLHTKYSAASCTITGG
ncbi:hypothetical protein HDU98_012319 [Podochytrium sp. JEL0797]|nr:hypothetical protein HDU98_012319 [Podochytrium sp. JEL0797]